MFQQLKKETTGRAANSMLRVAVTVLITLVVVTLPGWAPSAAAQDQHHTVTVPELVLRGVGAPTRFRLGTLRFEGVGRDHQTVDAGNLTMRGAVSVAQEFRLGTLRFDGVGRDYQTVDAGNLIMRGAVSSVHAFDLGTLRFRGTGPGSPDISARFDLELIGPEICVPPSCEEYELNATVAQGRQDGPVEMTITLPPGAEIETSRIDSGNVGCPDSGWMCTRTADVSGPASVCRSDICTLETNEVVLLRVKGNFASPDTIDESREICGTLEWREQTATEPPQRLERCRTTLVCHPRLIAHMGRCIAPDCPRATRWDWQEMRCLPY